MNPNTFNVHFVIRNNRMDQAGFAPIYAMIILNGKRLQFSLNIKIKPSDWDAKKEAPKLKDNATVVIKEIIDSFKSRIYQAYSKIIASNEELTVDRLKIAFSGETKKVQVHELIKTTIEHNSYFESMVGIKYSNGTYKNYKTTLKYLVEFIPRHYKKKDILLSAVDYKFCETFFTYLTTQKNCKVNGANKQIQRLKKIINYGLQRGYIHQNPMGSFKLKFTPVNKVALTLEELKRIHKLELQRETLKKVRDIFLLQCYTGLPYSGIKSLKASNIERDNNGDQWIRMVRQKTKIAFSVPLLLPALEIIDGFVLGNDGKDHILPVLSNQKMNDNLKVIQELAKINKPMTTHLARHTFATTITLANGVPIETVSRMLGHTKLSTTQVYAKVLDKKIGEDMKALQIKMKSINKEL